MTVERRLVAGVVAIVVATTLVSGPLVGAVDLTRAGGVDPGAAGSGSVDVGAVSFPDAGEISSGRFGADAHYLRVPDATVEFDRVIGQPIVTYRLSIPELGYAREAVHFVTAANEGQSTLSLGETELDAGDVTADAYDGELTVNVRSDSGSRSVASQNVTIEVVR